MSQTSRIAPGNTTFVLVSFEGPDRYAMAGGLGMRMAELSRALAGAGYRTHLVFVGDPHAPPTEVRVGGRLVLHRWCQWISKYYPGGVYQGEEDKLYDFAQSVPPWLAGALAAPAIAEGQLVVVMGEDWHTAETMCRISDALHAAGHRSRAVLLWNVNNLFGAHRVEWGRLGYVTAVTTVSRYMKRLLWAHGVNALVIPNGIPRRLLAPASPADAARVRRSLARPVVLTKVGRWDPDKRWIMAVEAVAALRAQGHDPVLLAIAGVEPHGGEVLARARSLGLAVADVSVSEPSLAGYARAFAEARGADLLNIRSFVPLGLLRTLYRASDAVLANSGHEPFGLVALEAMASGAVALSGGTGEDYAVHLENGIVLETADPEEIAWYVRFLKADPAAARRLARAARRTARRFVWERVVASLVDKLEFLAARQHALPAPVPLAEPAPAAEDRAVGTATAAR